MSNKKIWLICKYASPKKYFFGTRHFSFAKEWVKMGSDVTVISSNSSHMTNALPQFDGKHFIEFIDGIRTIWLNVKSPGKSSGFNRIWSWVMFEIGVFRLSKNQLERPDVVIVSSLSLFSIISGAYLSWKNKAKFILEIRDIWPLSAMELGGYSKWHPLMMFMSLLEWYGYRYADVIVGTMPNLKEHVLKVNKTAEEKVVCVPQCFDEEFYANEQEELPSYLVEKYFSDNRFRVIYAGTVSFNNPLNQLIEAVNGLEVDLVIVGNGAAKLGLVQKFGDLPNLIFLDAVQKNQVQHLLSFSSCCYDSISSRIGQFGLSRNKWVDYMMAGKPIICAFDGYHSMLNEANAGFFVPFDNVSDLRAAIKKVMLSPELGEQMGVRGKNWLLANRSSELLAMQYSILF